MTDYPRAPKQAIDGHLYADAGLLAAQVEERGVLVWRINPSPIGFTWAWVRTDRDDVEVARDSGYYLCPIAIEGGVYAASSDLAEFYALSQGLAALPPGWSGEVGTDSLVTIGRMFEGAACRGLPPSWRIEGRSRLVAAGRLWPIHLGGHPDPDELARGQRTTIHAADYSRPSRRVSVPVSPFNVLTDELASAQKPAALEAWHAKEADQDPPTIAATTPTPTDR